MKNVKKDEYKMKTIGMIVAVEMNAIFNRFGAKLSERIAAGYKVWEYTAVTNRLIIVNCGAGEIAAASGTQFLISEYHVDIVVNFGVVGGLTEEMAKTKLCIVDKVIHYDFDTSEADGTEVGRYLQYPDVYIPADRNLLDKAVSIHNELTPVICASADKFVADPNRKRELHQRFGADICEMEAAGILLTCNRNNVPCMLIKIVSDGITGGAEEFFDTLDLAADICLNVVSDMIERI